MTRKHFVQLAEVIKQIADPAQRRQAAEIQAGICAKANPRFDFRRFYGACNVKVEEVA